MYPERRVEHLKSGVLVIYGTDIDYGNKLMDYLNRKKNFSLNLMLFTIKEGFLDYVANNVIDILLISHEQLQELQLTPNITIIIILVDESYRPHKINYPTIFKYQSAETISKEILIHYMDNSKELGTRNIMGEEISMEVISVYSPTNSTLRTSFSIIMGETYSKTKRVLFIDLELFSALSVFLDYEMNKGISELIYFLKHENSNIILKINTLIHKIEGINYISGVEHGFDLYEINKDDIKSLLYQMKSLGEYECIIIDIGYMNQTIVEIFKLSDRIFIPHEGSRVSEKQNQELLNMLKLEDSSKAWENVEFITLPFKEKDINNRNDIQQMKEGSFGEAIRNLIK